MYTVTVNVKTTEGKKINLRHSFKTKRECKFYVEGIREIINEVDYSITKTKKL